VLVCARQFSCTYTDTHAHARKIHMHTYIDGQDAINIHMHTYIHGQDASAEGDV
jgi:hypothetical protein